MRNLLPVMFALLATTCALAQQTRETPIATGRLVVQGRLVDERGQPLARCEVRLSAHQSTGYAMAWSRTDWADPEPVQTGEDGRFRFDLRLPAADEQLDRGRYHLNVTHPRRVAWFSNCAFVVAQRRGGIDYGDIELPTGHYPRLRVEDQRGQLQPGVLVRLLATDHSTRQTRTPIDGPHSWLSNYGYQRTDIDGYLHLRSPLAAGTYKVELPERDVPTDLGRLELPDPDAYTAVVRAIPKQRVITGRVVDEQGAPVGGVRLRAGRGESCYSRRDGQFTLMADDDHGNGQPTELWVAHNRRFDGWHQAGNATWGSSDHELKVPTTGLRTFVVRGPGGVAIERFNLYCHPRDSEAGRPPVRLSGRFPDGRASARLAAGEWHVLVAPHDRRAGSSGWQLLEVGNDETIRLDLPAPVLRTVTVTDAGGAPVAGVLVEVLVGVAAEPFGFFRPATATHPPQGTVRSVTPLVAASRTDADGNATLRLSTVGPCSLRLSGGGVLRAMHAADLTADQPITLEARRGATLSATIQPLDALLRLDPKHDSERSPSIYAYHSRSAPRVRLVCGEAAQQRIVEDVILDQAGRFTCAGLPPGRVEVHLHTHPKATRSWLLGTFETKRDQPRELVLELPADAIGKR
ncbi:MAG: carboxypeptidase-like regulatory domain-containing protein [Planctomycetota bacterium]